MLASLKYKFLAQAYLLFNFHDLYSTFVVYIYYWSFLMTLILIESFTYNIEIIRQFFPHHIDIKKSIEKFKF